MIRWRLVLNFIPISCLCLSPEHFLRVSDFLFDELVRSLSDAVDEVFNSQIKDEGAYGKGDYNP